MSLGFSAAPSSFTSTPSPILPTSEVRSGPALDLTRVPLGGPWPYGHPYLGQSSVPEQGSSTGLSSGVVPMAGGTSIMENWENWRQFQQAAYANNLDPHLLAFYHNASCAMDLSSTPRRKNATRETTSMLKAWLSEHRKNPYPTKGEKIMLAIITKMSLTQVSTWFANARRRLKKENKMTWSPRNRSEEHGGQRIGGGEGAARAESDLEEDEDYCQADGQDDIGDDDLIELDQSKELRDHLPAVFFPPTNLDNKDLAGKSSPAPSSEPQTSSSESKPKIWSLADLATKTSDHQPPPPLGRLLMPGLLPGGTARLALPSGFLPAGHPGHPGTVFHAAHPPTGPFLPSPFLYPGLHGFPPIPSFAAAHPAFFPGSDLARDPPRLTPESSAGILHNKVTHGKHSSSPSCSSTSSPSK